MQENTQKITKEFCKGKRLLFYPASVEETVFIQRNLLDMGFKWDESGATVANIDKCISTGMVLKEGVMYTEPSEESQSVGLLCNSSQFDKDYLPPDQAFMLEQFNKLSSKIADLEEKIDALNEELHPKTLDKAPLLSSKKARTPGQ